MPRKLKVRYGAPLKLTIEGPVGSGRSDLTHWLYERLERNKANTYPVIFKITGDYEFTVRVPMRLTREKEKPGVLYKPYKPYNKDQAQ
jgi:pantothenate kinase-related protein Tda10